MTEGEVERHYGSADVCARILAALAGAGHGTGVLTRDTVTPFDEFHGGGIASTRELAAFAGFRPDLNVLDIGCGIGGPARTLAAEYGCHVTGIDLTREFVRAADMLTGRLAMTDRCRFLHGSATALPFGDGHFDAVWSQNMMMNVEDKARLFAEVVRVLAPGGVFAFEAVVSGNGEPLHFPTFWAPREALNFLVSQTGLIRLLADAGLTREALEDTTDAVIATGRKRRAAIESADPGQLTIAVIVPDDVASKMQNAVLNNEHGATRTIRGVYRKPA